MPAAALHTVDHRNDHDHQNHAHNGDHPIIRVSSASSRTSIRRGTSGSWNAAWWCLTSGRTSCGSLASGCGAASAWCLTRCWGRPCWWCPGWCSASRCTSRTCLSACAGSCGSGCVPAPSCSAGTINCAHIVSLALFIRSSYCYSWFILLCWISDFNYSIFF